MEVELVKRRPLTAITMAFVIGIVLQNSFKIPLKYIHVLIVASFVFCILQFILRKNTSFLLWILTFFLLGALNFGYYNNIIGQLSSFTDRQVILVGDAIQNKMGDRDEYLLYTDKLIYNGKSYNIKEKTLLKILHSTSVKENFNNKKVKIKGKLIIPNNSRNPKMFDYNMYLKTQGIHTILYANNFDVKIIGEAGLPHYIKLRYNIKSYIYNKVFEMLPSNEGEIGLSIVFGDKSILQEDIYESFRISGIAHVLAVSGLHFGILYLFFNTLLIHLRLREAYRITILLGVIWFFAFIVGFTPSSLRASAMLTIYVFSNILDRRYDLFSSLALICLITIVVNPLITFNISFQLSFAAVTAIGLFYIPICEKLVFLPNFFKKIIAVSFAAQLGTAPIMAFHFNSISPLSIIYNIPAIFLMGYILPTTLLFFVLLFINEKLAGLIGYIDKVLIKLLIWLSQLSQHIHFSSFDVISPRIHFFIFYYSLLILIFYKGKITFLGRLGWKKIVAAILMIYLLLNSFIIIFPKELKITFVDVGQGDCILIETPKAKKILIDGGRSMENEILPEFLLKNHISSLDLIFITHIHDDHIGGVIDVIEKIKTKQIVIGTDKFISENFIRLKDISQFKNIPIHKIHRKQYIPIEKDLNIRILHPALNVMTNTEDDVNNNSLVFILEYKDVKFLFTGDIQREAEAKIISSTKRQDINVIKIGHHGSRTSTSTEFIKYFTPEIAVIQVGKNLFGHPHKEVLRILKQNNVKVYRNDENGAVIIKTDGRNIEIKTLLNN